MAMQSLLWYLFVKDLPWQTGYIEEIKEKFQEFERERERENIVDWLQ